MKLFLVLGIDPDCGQFPILGPFCLKWGQDKGSNEKGFPDLFNWEPFSRASKREDPGIWYPENLKKNSEHF